jgi:hypothetical protein
MSKAEAQVGLAEVASLSNIDTSAYVSIRQHTLAYVSICEHEFSLAEVASLSNISKECVKRA